MLHKHTHHLSIGVLQVASLQVCTDRRTHCGDAPSVLNRCAIYDLQSHRIQA